MQYLLIIANYFFRFFFFFFEGIVILGRLRVEVGIGFEMSMKVSSL
jgi:hypothetical protein